MTIPIQVGIMEYNGPEQWLVTTEKGARRVLSWVEFSGEVEKVADGVFIVEADETCDFVRDLMGHGFVETTVYSGISHQPLARVWAETP